MVNQLGIEANLKKINAILEMSSPKSIKDVQPLTRRIVAINRFVSWEIEICFPFFKALQGSKQFKWIEECEYIFQQLSSPPLLSKALQGEHFIFYLTDSTTAMNFLFEAFDYDLDSIRRRFL